VARSPLGSACYSCVVDESTAHLLRFLFGWKVSRHTSPQMDSTRCLLLGGARDAVADESLTTWLHHERVRSKRVVPVDDGQHLLQCSGFKFLTNENTLRDHAYARGTFMEATDSISFASSTCIRRLYHRQTLCAAWKRFNGRYLDATNVALRAPSAACGPVRGHRLRNFPTAVISTSVFSVGRVSSCEPHAKVHFV